MTCKSNEAVALNTITTSIFVDQNDVKTLKADKTGESPEIDRLLVELGNTAKSIPFYAVYHPDQDEAIAFGGLVGKSQVMNALRGNSPEETAWATLPIPLVFALALVAGLILNVMPCVLPVIGLKIMSFVQQAGESRFRIFALNMWFSFGLLSVFWVLATIPVSLSLLGEETIGWGGQFAYAPFAISLIAVVVAFAFAFLGVWEVPIPGFAGGSAASELASKEGYSGAFIKGVLATVLATPCTGPLLGPAIGWAVAQPPLLTYLAFTAVGLGMALPYLLIGAFPKLIGFLPKPGAWMDTFKQVMGFAVWIFTFMNEGYFVQSYWLLFAIGVACWIVGRTPITAEFPRKAKAWAAAAAIVSIVAVLAFVRVPPAKATGSDKEKSGIEAKDSSEVSSTNQAVRPNGLNAE